MGFGNNIMIFPVKVFKLIKGVLALVRTHTVEELEERSNAVIRNFNIHPSVARLTKKEKEEQRKNV